MKRILLNISIVIVALFIIVFYMYFVNGSLEMYPTPEREEGIKEVTSTLVILFAGLEIVLICLRIKMKKR
ncbi:hypothetical protein QTL86_06595 [Cellulosilyticum sp. ST5]|uniref:hypothetical protein n=1 Tax=unclassified Cellulosilyticum TaxID=2643091 RepID=UPI000F8D4299|nr:hypothetical protein [Cellulosilyticum sp. WCF-2]QEH69311.1 hypothetical protein EKH84_13265 [Cellulosilyticum sp. WCF-2]